MHDTQLGALSNFNWSKMWKLSFFSTLKCFNSEIFIQISGTKLQQQSKKILFYIMDISFIFDQTISSTGPTPDIRELRSIETYDIRYFTQHVLLCTSTVHEQSANICIQGYLRILWIQNPKSSKID